MATTSEQTQQTFTVFKPPRSWIRWTGVVLAAAGWWLSFDLARIGFNQAATNPWLQAQCGPTAETSETLDCQSVLGSKWASVPIGSRPDATRIPVATLGMGYFAFVGLWYLFVGAPTRSRWARHLLILLIVGCGAMQSLNMLHVMGNVLHKWCAGCLAAHAVNAALIVLTVIAFPWRRDRAGVAPHPRGRLALATLAACAFLFLLHPALTLVLLANNYAGRVSAEYSKIVDDPEFVRWQYERQPLRTIIADQRRAYVGDSDAPNTVVAFIDIQCTPCMTAFATLNDVMHKHPGVLRVDYRHFPLDRSCNDAWPRAGHPESCQAATAVEAARAVGGAEGFRQMRTLLYQHRHELQSAPYSAYAQEIGIDVPAFSEALQSETIKRAVREDVELGRQLGVEAVPVLFLNGRRLNHWRKPETWEALLRLENVTPSGAPPVP
jgi:protein-disulfide isomerase/uncharacterized membrane protein